MNIRGQSQVRGRIAQECARIMVQEHLDDYLMAKQKAAARLGMPNTRELPSNQEIADALLEYRRLFGSDAEMSRLRAQRQAALNAMEMLHEFVPRLAGPVLYGTAGEHTEIQLHLFHDAHEEVGLFLMTRNIPYQLGERRFASIDKTYPGYRFVAGQDRFLLVVFPYADLRRPPPDPLDGKAMRRADVESVRKLLENSG